MKINLMLLALGLVFPSSIALGQKPAQDDGPVGIFPTRAEYNTFMGEAKLAAYGENGSPELQAMLPMLNDIALNRPAGWTANEYGMEGSAFGLLSSSDIRDELEMVDDQYEELQRLSSEIQKRAAEQLRELDFSNRRRLVEQVQNIRERASTELNAVLLPHQLERLRQIRMQSQLRRRSLVEILTSDPVKSELEITDRQSDELRREEKEIEEYLAKEIAKLRKQAQDRLLSKLDPKQKAEAEEMLGDAFEFAKSNDKKTSKPRKGGGK